MKPSNSGTLYYNYKGFFSIVILALVDGEYTFLWADVGSPGSNSDCGIYNRSRLQRKLSNGRMGFPQPDPLPNDDQDITYFIVGDDAFPLRDYLVKPYSKRFLSVEERIFNYRCSRARRVVENSFGMLAMRFRCLLTTLAVCPPTAKKIAKCCMTLHNIMRIRHPHIQNNDIDREDDDHDLIPGAWRNEAIMLDVEVRSRGPRQTAAGKRLRAYLMHYYNSDAGSVPWQRAAIDRPLA